MNEKFLPIGTVCRLKGGKKGLMIIGFCPSDTNNPNKIFDYTGCLFPEGMISSDYNLVFNHDQIEEIYFRGFENEEQKQFMVNLNNVLASNNASGNATNNFINNNNG